MRQYFTDDIGAEHASLQSYELCIALYLKDSTLSPFCYPVRASVRALLSHSDNDPIHLLAYRLLVASHAVANR